MSSIAPMSLLTKGVLAVGFVCPCLPREPREWSSKMYVVRDIWQGIDMDKPEACIDVVSRLGSLHEVTLKIIREEHGDTSDAQEVPEALPAA